MNICVLMCTSEFFIYFVRALGDAPFKIDFQPSKD